MVTRDSAGDSAYSDAALEAERLGALLRTYEHEYFVLGRPSVSDAEYDRLFERLREIESRYPDLQTPDSPTVRVGSDLSSDLPEVSHSIPVMSLDKAYSVQEILTWITRIEKTAGQAIDLLVEEKIDGVSIVLYYEDGVLARAVTRGNGFVGNDVTANVKTIRSVPLRIGVDHDLAVRGEIYLPRESFQRINDTLEVPYANPRNLAAGSIRRIKSAEVAHIPLEMFAYEGFISGAGTHVEAMRRLRELGFRLNPRVGLFGAERPRTTVGDLPEGAVVGDLSDLEAFVRLRTDERESLPYEIDGLVVKVNDMAAREELGYTGHHPRWAIAYKFDAPESVTQVRAVDVQVGRTGRVTPVARVEPVQIGGSTVSNVTLHNQDYIDILELAVGDTVAVSKRGDVIPAVERVVEKNEHGNTTWTMPSTCPSCGAELVIRGAHHFCPDDRCPAQIRGRLHFFVSRNQMDIENLGPETIDVLLERNMVERPEDLYALDYDRLLDVAGFGAKKVSLIKQGIEESKNRPFRVVLPALGVPELGPKVTELLIEDGITDIDMLLQLSDADDAERLVRIDGIGEKTAITVLSGLKAPEVRQTIAQLRRAGLRFRESETEAVEPTFSGQVWCVTGSFEAFSPRDRAMDEVRRRGGRVVSQVSGTTTHLLAGERAGSKLAKARKLGTTVVSEAEFLKMIGEDKVDG